MINIRAVTSIPKRQLSLKCISYCDDGGAGVVFFNDFNIQIRRIKMMLFCDILRTLV